MVGSIANTRSIALTITAMNYSNTAATLERFLTEREGSFFPSSRRDAVVRYFERGHGSLPPTLQRFLDWARSHADQFDCILLWGSYVTAAERDESFSFPHGYSDTVALGPSDLDGLVVTNNPLKPPRLDAIYTLFDYELRPLGVFTQNLYRDVIFVATDELSRRLASAVERHRACIVDAYSRAGIVLKTNPAIDAIIRGACPDLDCEVVGREAMKRRRERLTEIARRAWGRASPL